MAAPAIRSSVVATDGLAKQVAAGTQIGDCILVFTWEQQSTIPNHTLVGGYTEVFTQGYDEGTTDGRLSVAFIEAALAGGEFYQAYTTDAGTPAPITGLLVLETGTWDETFANWVVATPVVDTSNAQANPPSVNLSNLKDWLVICGEAFRQTADTNFTPPTNYTEQWESAGTATRGNLCVDTRALAPGAGVEDPGVIGDTTAPSGTVAFTFAIPNPSAPAAWRPKRGYRNFQAVTRASRY